MVARQIPAFKLVPHPLSEESEMLLHRPAFVDPSIGDRHRLGGSPDRWTEAAAPRCPSCGDDMTFYGQLDALPSAGFDLADAGLIFVYVCFDCLEVSAALDSA
jgi:hypothetical protein